MRRIVTAGWLILVCAGLWHCAAPTASSVPQSPDTPRVYVEGVPFYPQKEFQCGPASLAAVLNFWGKTHTPDEIAKAVYMPQLRGSLSLDLWQYALRQGMQATVQKGSIETLRAHLEKREPVVAFLNLGFDWLPVGHFLVVVGLDPAERKVITYSGTDKDSRYSYDRFIYAWEKTGYWSLVVTPPSDKGSG